MHELQEAMSHDQHLQHLMQYIIQGWPGSKNQLPHDIRTYWMFIDDMAVVNGVVIKGRCIVIPQELQQQVPKQLHINHIGIEKKNKLLAYKSLYWIGMNADIEDHIKNIYSTCLDSQHTQPKETFIHHDIPDKL